MTDTSSPQTDRPRALALLEAADFLRDAHFRDGLTVQEIGTALRHMADEADPMVGSLARDGLGLDEIAAMPVAPSAGADRAALSAKLWAVAEHHIVAEWICCEPLEPRHTLCAKGYAALGMARTLLVDSPEAWNPEAPLLNAVLALLPGRVADEEQRQAEMQAPPLLFWDEPAGVDHEDGRITAWLSRAVTLAQSVPAGQLILRVDAADRLRRALATALNDAYETQQEGSL